MGALPVNRKVARAAIEDRLLTPEDLAREIIGALGRAGVLNRRAYNCV